ncbi:hypothetical protein RBSWK_05563 [Rhodopirellula baltica SWK14]|uniref:Uncharacterized protein n=1 Tax=Rhodopirellula baltica SWK14 TaxID=993516 RepID=L7CA43_RHOBT|nr:hypothetical protein RBSWK_05563 [Rhodopirellula baltica SWK14]
MSRGPSKICVGERPPSPGTERRLSICETLQAVLRVHGIVLPSFASR